MHKQRAEAMDARVPSDRVIPLNIPNSLTILRILLIPVIVGLLIYGYVASAFMTLLLAAATDVLDGSIARLANQKTRFGACLDPLADKLLIMTTFITLAWLSIVPVWSVLVIVSRDAMLLTGWLLARLTHVPVDTSPTALGKATTFLQVGYGLVAVGLTARGTGTAPVLPLLYMMSLLTALSGLHYIFRGVGRLHASEES